MVTASLAALQVLPAVGHTVHEDSPDKVAEVLAAFLVSTPQHSCSVPGCSISRPC